MNDEFERSFDHEGSRHRFPFGNPDGSKADLGESFHRFVRLDQREFTSGISTLHDDRSIRIIVGKKGAGKTIYLRRLQDSTRRENSVTSEFDVANEDEIVFASKISKDIPTTQMVMGFCQVFDTEKVTEAWQTAWRIAIMRSVISHLRHKKFFREYIDQKSLNGKLVALGEENRHGATERSPYSELKDIISDNRSEATFFRFSGASKWDELQTLIGNVLKQCPPVFFYMDASDDEFGHAPMDWHRCQKGLFYAVMRLLDQHGAISSRLHVVIAIRDIVYSSVMEGEHRTRYLNSPSICLLDWDYYSIRHFLNQKLMGISEEYFDAPEDRSLGSFLSTETISNTKRGCVETATDYLIRHTRGLPRDIIQVGNRLAREKIQIRARGESRAHWLNHIKSTVSSLARTFAEEQLTTCAHQLASHDAPAHSVKHRYDEVYTSNKEYLRYRLRTMKDFVKLLGSESFSYDDLNEADKHLSADIASGVPISTILWQNGLIGIKKRVESAYFEFYSLSRDSDFILPDFGHEYAFHSIMIDLVPSLSLKSSTPVIDKS